MPEPHEHNLPHADGLSAEYKPGLVSVLVTLGPSATGLGDTLSSILAQSYEKVETFVVDAGSEEQTAGMVQEWAQRFRQKRGWGIAYLPTPGRDSSARREGARAAHGEFLNFVTCGDILLPEKLHGQVAVLARVEEFGAVYGFAEEYRASNHELAGHFRLDPPDKLLALLSPGPRWGHAQAFLWRRAGLLAAKALPDDGDAWSDWAHLVRFVARGQKLACVRKVSSRCVAREPQPESPEQIEARLGNLEAALREVQTLHNRQYLTRLAYLLCEQAYALQSVGESVGYYRATALIAEVVERRALPLKLRLAVNSHGQLRESIFPVLYAILKRSFQVERLRWEAKPE
jgi:glycosyltransferase involved in cell wall biosynthesis